jgi:hypothetical protein
MFQYVRKLLAVSGADLAVQGCRKPLAAVTQVPAATLALDTHTPKASIVAVNVGAGDRT